MNISDIALLAFQSVRSIVIIVLMMFGSITMAKADPPPPPLALNLLNGTGPVGSILTVSACNLMLKWNRPLLGNFSVTYLLKIVAVAANDPNYCTVCKTSPTPIYSTLITSTTTIITTNINISATIPTLQSGQVYVACIQIVNPPQILAISCLRFRTNLACCGCPTIPSTNLIVLPSGSQLLPQCNNPVTIANSNTPIAVNITATVSCTPAACVPATYNYSIKNSASVVVATGTTTSGTSFPFSVLPNQSYAVFITWTCGTQLCSCIYKIARQ